MFSILPKDPNYKYAFISFAVCGLMLLASIINVFTIVLSPAKFVCIFTFSVLSGLMGLAWWNGPQVYMNKIFEKQYLVRTVTLFVSMGLSLWFSIVNKSYIMSLVFCLIEFNAIMLYFCNSFPAGGSL